MTAVETFYAAVEDGNLPAGIPVEDEYGDPGMAAAGLTIRPHTKAYQMAYSNRASDRAKVALMAIQHVRRVTVEQFENITPL